KGYKTDFGLNDIDYIKSVYRENIEKVKKMSFEEIIKSDIHPLFKIDPLSYAHLVNPKIVTFIEALFDKTLSRKSRKLLLKEFKGCKHYRAPVGHVTWLPFEYLLAHYILNKLNIKDSKIRIRLLEKDKISDNFNNFINK
ncbi:MAG: alpha/beta hydrolase, partial [Thermotogota bacterium]